MLSFHRSFLGGMLLISLVSCTTSPETPSESAVDNRPVVVATTSVLCDLTQQIAQDTVNLQCLMAGGVDPHVYQPTPEDRQKIDQAQLILYGGYNFDSSLIKLIEASPNTAPRVAVHEKAVPSPLMGADHDHDHDHDSHHHDGEKAAESVPDPHIWHDPRNGQAMVAVISQELSTLQPEQASTYQAQAQAIKAELTEIDQWIRRQIATIPPQNRKLVTTHDVLGYYVKAYDLEFKGAIEGLSTDSAPTAAKMSELAKDLRKSDVPMVFPENSVNPKLLETVAREAQVNVSPKALYADGLGQPGSEGDTYQKMLIANTQTIVEGLGGQLSPLQPAQ